MKTTCLAHQCQEKLSTLLHLSQIVSRIQLYFSHPGFLSLLSPNPKSNTQKLGFELEKNVKYSINISKLTLVVCSILLKIFQSACFFKMSASLGSGRCNILEHRTTKAKTNIHTVAIALLVLVSFVKFSTTENDTSFPRVAVN